MSKTWNLTLTPEGTPSSTLTGLSSQEAAAVLRDLVHGGTHDAARMTQPTERRAA